MTHLNDLYLSLTPQSVEMSSCHCWLTSWVGSWMTTPISLTTRPVFSCSALCLTTWTARMWWVANCYSTSLSLLLETLKSVTSLTLTGWVLKHMLFIWAACLCPQGPTRGHVQLIMERLLRRVNRTVISMSRTSTLIVRLILSTRTVLRLTQKKKSSYFQLFIWKWFILSLHVQGTVLKSCFYASYK